MTPEQKLIAYNLLIDRNPRVNPRDIYDMDENQLVDAILGELKCAIDEIEELNEGR